MLDLLEKDCNPFKIVLLNDEIVKELIIIVDEKIQSLKGKLRAELVEIRL